MKEPIELREDVARALRMLANAAPPEGMEARVVERMRQRQAELSVRAGGRRNVLWWGCAVAAAGVVAVVVMLSQREVRGPVMVHHVAVESPRSVVPAVQPRIVPVKASIRRSGRTVRVAAETRSMVPPPLPLTQQERLLLALAHTPQFGPPKGLDSVTTTETVADHGLGKNAILELPHQELTQLKTTFPGDNE